MFKTFCKFPLLLLAVYAFAENAGPPVTGYIAESSGVTLRALLGVPGGLYLSEPLPLPEATTRVRVAPGNDVAWLEQGGASPTLLMLKRGSVDRIVPVPGALPTVDWVVFSPSAKSAVVYSATTSRLQVVTGLPDAPRILRDLDAGLLPERPLTAAISDDGATLVTASGAAVYLVASDGSSKTVLAAQDIHSVIMIPNSSDVLAADSATGAIQLLQHLDSAPVTRTVAYDRAGIENISTTWDGSTALTLRPDAKALDTVDIASGTVNSIALDTIPELLMPMSNRDVFLTSSQAGEPGCVFYRGQDGHVLLFPAARGQGRPEVSR